MEKWPFYKGPSEYEWVSFVFDTYGLCLIHLHFYRLIWILKWHLIIKIDNLFVKWAESINDILSFLSNNNHVKDKKKK